MVGKYPVITLCGSTRFKRAFEEANKQLTLAGCDEWFSDAHGENEIAEVLQKGYKLGDTVIRPAMVKVAN